MKSRKTYSGEFKAQVVIEYIKGNMSLNEIANEHQIHPNQIKNWKTTLLKRAHEVLDDKRSRSARDGMQLAFDR